MNYITIRSRVSLQSGISFILLSDYIHPLNYKNSIKMKISIRKCATDELSSNIIIGIIILDYDILSHVSH